jgi:methylenetetrahydrofolate dehydrogenase (NADP+)/methenyltetrahydrofolate cyclohydrolase
MAIDGRKIADGILKKLHAQPKPAKFLAAVLVGDDKSSISFLAQKEKTAKALGVDFRLYKFPADIKNDKLREEVGKIGAHKTCGGVIVQLPLPDSLNWYYILNAIPPEKDVDVLGERSLGAFYVGRSEVLPPAVSTVEAITEDSKLALESLNVAIVGLGLLIGRPVTSWIMRRAKETFLLRSTSDMTVLKKADLVITGVGKSGLIKAEMLKDGAKVIDFGYQNGNGDFDNTDLGIAEGKNITYTPTPGGTGPVLVAKVFENFYKLNS